MNKKIAVVIPCHNNLEVLKASIPAIYSDDYALVVFDDGSSDGTKLWLKNKYPKIKVLSGDGSNWWAALRASERLTQNSSTPSELFDDGGACGIKCRRAL